MTLLGSIASLLTGALLLGVVARVAVPPATWIALILLLHASRSLPAFPGLVWIWLALYAALAAGNWGVVPAPVPQYFGITAAIASSFAIAFVVDRIVGTRFGIAGQILVFPLAWVAVEFLRARFVPGAATWGSLAYSQYGNLPLMQVAAVTGIWGISFLIAWGASTVETAWARRFDGNLPHAPIVIYGSALAIAIALGSWRLAQAPTDRPVTRAATVTRPIGFFAPGEMTRITEGRVPPEDRARVRALLARLHDWFLEHSRREARAGARIVAWPEGNLLVLADDEAAFLARAKELAAGERIYLVMGMGTITPGSPQPFENKSVVVDPSGSVAISYRKSHPVPGWEAGIMQRGEGRVPVASTGLGGLSTLICFDGDFPEFVRQAAVGRADLLVVPANDWPEIKALHLQMHVFRAIETGVPVLRAAASGISGAVDPWGRVLGTSDDFAESDRTFTAQLPIGSVRTLYARIGDAFAWLCVMATAGVLILLSASRQAAS